MTQTLEALALPEQYRQTRAHLFPSEQSLLWFLRKHRRELVSAGALLIVAGRNHIDPTACDEVVLRVGRAAAERGAA